MHELWSHALSLQHGPRKGTWRPLAWLCEACEPRPGFWSLSKSWDSKQGLRPARQTMLSAAELVEEVAHIGGWGRGGSREQEWRAGKALYRTLFYFFVFEANIPKMKFYKNYILFIYLSIAYECACIYVHHTCAWCAKKSEVLDALEMKLQTVWGTAWVLGIEPRSSLRATETPLQHHSACYILNRIKKNKIQINFAKEV